MTQFPRVIIITGTGTNVGKTHVAQAMIAELSTTHVVAGVKPVETGVGTIPDDAERDGNADETILSSDADRIRRACAFHVKQLRPTYCLPSPVSPHLAARRMGITIDLNYICRVIDDIRANSEVTIVELAGGLFTPLSDECSNADLIRKIPNARTILVAPDRLGVLHDIAATTMAAEYSRTQIHGIVLNAPESDDASTNTNCAEIPLITSIPIIATLPRASYADLATQRYFTNALHHLLSA